MAIAVTCPGCGVRLRFRGDHAGQRTTCRNCHAPLVVQGERIPDHDVFVSYSSKDKPIADAICAAMEARRMRCWVAPRDILAGKTWAGAILDAIDDASVMVLVFSTSANNSPQVLREVNRAVKRGVTIVPFRIEETAMSKDMEYYIATAHWLDAMNEPMEQAVAKLSDTVKRLLDARRPHPPGLSPLTGATAGSAGAATNPLPTPPPSTAATTAATVTTATPRNGESSPLESARRRTASLKIALFILAAAALVYGVVQFASRLHKTLSASAGSPAATTHQASTSAPDKDDNDNAGWIDLFNGRDITDWQSQGGNWSVKNGILVGRVRRGVNGSLSLPGKSFSDFDLHVEAMINIGGAGDIAFRSTPEETYKVRVNCSNTNPNRTGSLAFVSQRIRARMFADVSQTDTTGEKWFNLDVTAEGRHFSARVDGKEVAHGSDSHIASGTIGLEVWQLSTLSIRKIRIRARASAPADTTAP